MTSDLGYKFSMEDPIVEDQLLGLSPRAKVNAGALMGIAGAISFAWLWERGWIAGLPIFALVMGALLIWTGRQELARVRAVESEMAKARTEWAELEHGITQAKSNGKSPVRFLQARGYNEFHVRRWIVESVLGGDEEGVA